MTRPTAEAKEGVPTTLEGYILVGPNSRSTIGSRGGDAFAPAMSKEIAEKIMQEETQAGISMRLQSVPNARFINLPEGRIHDNRDGKTYESYADYIKRLFVKHK